MLDWNEFQSYCMPIIVQKLVEQHGRDIDLLASYNSCVLDTDYEFQSIWEAIEAVCDLDVLEDENDYSNSTINYL